MSGTISNQEFQISEPRLDYEDKPPFKPENVYQFLFDHVESKIRKEYSNFDSSLSTGIASSATLSICWTTMREIESPTSDIPDVNVPKTAKHWQKFYRQRATWRTQDAINPDRPQGSGLEGTEELTSASTKDRKGGFQAIITDPQEHALATENHDRRDELLQTIFDAYRESYEARQAYFKKEVYERGADGQVQELIVERIGGSERLQKEGFQAKDLNAAKQRISEICKGEKDIINRLIKEMDSNGTIAPTAHKRSDKKRRDSIHGSQFEGPIMSTAEHLLQKISEDGLLCPSVERLKLLSNPDVSKHPTDLVYHVFNRRFTGHRESLAPEAQETGCRKCQTLLKTLCSQ